MVQRREEDGFTLIELIISMGVFSIVAIAIALFLQTGTNSYSRARSELNLQMESQMLINQIRDMTYSSNYAEFQPGAAATDPSYLRLYQIKKDYAWTPSPAPSGAAATPTPAPTGTPNPSATPGASSMPLGGVVTGSKQIATCEVIVWDPATKKLYYDKSTAPDAAHHAPAPAVNLSDSGWRTKHLFCSYVESFSVDTDAGKIPNNTINLDIDMKAQNRKYKLREGITVRNKWVEYP